MRPSGGGGPKAAPEGRRSSTIIDENEAFAFCERLGLRVPRRVYVTAPGGVGDVDLGGFPGDRVVVKAVAPDLAHKTEVGAIAVCRKSAADIGATVAEMFDRFAGERLSAVGLHEFVARDAGFAGELLLGFRETADFGPVVTLGLGGVDVERLAGWEPFHLAAGEQWTDRPEETLAAHALTAFLTSPSRSGAPRIAARRLVEILAACLALAEQKQLSLTEFEVNPLVFASGEPVALDVLARRSEKPQAPRARPLERLASLLRPRSIAVAGVSTRRNPGRVILENILQQGFDSESVFVIKPGVEKILGCCAFARVAELPAAVDLLVLALAADAVAPIVEEITATEKAETVILVPGGLEERGGSEGAVARIEQAIARARCSEWGGPLLVGGNSLGVRSRPGRYDTLFIPREKLAYPSDGESSLALISQSGAFAIARSSKLWSLDPRYVISVGNQIDLTLGDYLTYLASDEGVRVFSCYAEGFRTYDGVRFLQAAEKISQSGRAIVLYRAGRTSEGARAAVTHTAAVAGDYALTRQLGRRAGVLVADSIEEFEDLTRTACLLDQRSLTGGALGAMSNAGFECVAIADHLGSMSLAGLAQETRERLTELVAAAGLESIIGVQNPLDLTPMLGDRAFVEAASWLIRDPNVDLAVVGCVPLTPALQTLARDAGHDEDVEAQESVARGLQALWRSTTKPWVAVVDAGPAYSRFRSLLESAGIPTFETVDRAVRTLGEYSRWRLERRSK